MCAVVDLLATLSIGMLAARPAEAFANARVAWLATDR